MKSVVLHSLLICLTAGVALAQSAGPQPQSPTNWFVGGNMPGPTPADAKSVKIDEHPNAQLPLDLSFVDEAGKTVQLKQYFSSGKPVVLQFGYFGCPMLCSLVSQALVDSLKDVKLNAGSDYQVVYVSIDPSETPALAQAKKDAYVQAYGRASGAEGWHLLTGKAPDIRQLADAAGFEYRWIDSAQQFSHPACLIVCTPDGRVSRYLYGVRYEPSTVRLSLVEASNGKIGTTADRFTLTCFQYDGTQGRYAFVAINLMKVSGAFTILAVGGMVFWFARRGRSRV